MLFRYSVDQGVGRPVEHLIYYLDEGSVHDICMWMGGRMGMWANAFAIDYVRVLGSLYVRM